MGGENPLAVSRLAVLAALRNMLHDSYFSICTIDACAEALDVPVKGSNSYRTLRALHCVHYREMPPELLRELPWLIGDCLGFAHGIGIVKEESDKKAGFFKRLIGKGA